MIIASNIKYLANMILSAVGVMAAHKQDFQMLGVVDLAAWPTFLGGSRMWVSSSGWQRSILSFNPVDFMPPKSYAFVFASYAKDVKI